jgi:oxalate decarboxylase/phosphoglucose isomerase-like protein (cupin superfamily)
MKFNIYKASFKKAIYTLCSRLIYPTQYYHYAKNIGRGCLWILEVFNGLVKHIYRD